MHYLKFYCTITLLLGSILVFGQTDAEQVIIFIDQSTFTPFTKKTIDSLTTELKALGLTVHQKDIQNGAPKEVLFTPYIVYQNHLGRSAYKGRYTTFSRILNFIRTVRFSPTTPTNYTKKEVFKVQQGRMTTFLELKITELSGNMPDNFDQAAFLEDIHAGLAKGFKDFEKVDELSVKAADQVFYFNFYPYMGEDEQLYISGEIFSAHHCFDPIFKTTEPFTGTYKKRVKLFSKVGKAFETIWKNQQTGSLEGDATHPVISNIAEKTWEALGFTLPEPPKNAANFNLEDFKMPTIWTYVGEVDKLTPAVSFYFPEPITQYSGEASNIIGEMALDETASQPISGKFTVKTESTTMGLEDLDHKLHDYMIEIATFPESYFTFNKIEGDEGILELGKTQTFNIEGTFELRGATQSTIAIAQITPILTKEGQPRLWVAASFGIQQIAGTFGLDNPPGPVEASDQLLFKVEFLMAPKEGN